MAWHSQDGVQQTPWQEGYPPPASFPVAARHRPCDSQEHAYSRALYTNYEYTTAAHPPVTPMSYPAPLSTHVPDAQIREADFRSWAAQRVEHGNRAALWAEQCEAGFIQQYGSSYPYRIEVQSSHTATCLPEAQATSPATARPPRVPRQVSRVEEEAARHSKPAASPPPRPTRSATRSRPPPVPPPSTPTRIDTRNDEARVQLCARDTSPATTWQVPHPARLPSPPGPPPRPARAAARQPSTPMRQEHPLYAQPCTTPARATSSGDAGRTAQMDDRRPLSPTSTASAPSTCPATRNAAPSLCQRLPPPPPCRYGPRSPTSDPDHHSSTIEADDVLQDADYIRAIASYAEEGGEGKSAQRREGKNALTRSVRGTQISASCPANSHFPRDREPPRAARPISRTVSTPAANTGDGRREQRLHVAAEAILTTPYKHASRETTSAKKADRGDATKTSPAIYPFPYTAGLAPSRGMEISDTRRATARADGGNTIIAALPRPPRSALQLSTPPSRSCPPLSRPAPSKHPTSRPSPHATLPEVPAPPPRPTSSSARDTGTAATSSHGHQDATQRAAPCAEAETREEYTRADDFRLARAPAQGRGIGLGRAHRADPCAYSACFNTTTSHITPPSSRPALALRGMALEEYTTTNHVRLTRAPAAYDPARPVARGREQEGGNGSRRVSVNSSPGRYLPSRHPAPSVQATVMRNRATPEEVRILTTKHPLPPLASQPPSMPFPPPQGSSSLPPPPPADWPFPMSVEELGWVLVAVVMARRMDQEDEQRRHDEEYEDGDSFVFERAEMRTYEDDPSHDFSRNSNDGHPVLSPYSDEHVSNAGTTSFVESTPRSLRHDSPISYSSDFNTAIMRDWQDDKYPSDTHNSASTAALPAAFVDIEHSDGDSQDWEEPSAPWDESSRDFVDHDECG